MGTIGTVLLIIAIVASLLVAIQLLFRFDSNRYAVGLLTLFMFTQALMNTMFLLVQTGLILDYWFFYRVFAPLGFAVPSLVYLYLFALLKDIQRPRIQDGIHLIPTIGMAINYIPYFKLSSQEKQQVLEAVVNDYTVYVQGQEGFIPESWVTVIRLILPLVYIPLYYRLLLHTRPQFDPQNQFDRQLRRWVWSFTNAVVLYFAGVMVFLMVYLVPERIASTPEFGQWMNIIFFFTFLFWAGSFLFFSLYQVLNPAVGIGYIFTSNGSRVDANPSPEIADGEIQRIRALFDEAKIWQNPHVIVSDIAREAQLSVRKASYIINRFLGGNANTVINRYRIEHAKSLIHSGYLDDYSIVGLVKECGFKNKVTFFNAFKRETGMTPSEYRTQKQGSH